MITVVSGLGRCGSSMLMQMLIAGGMRPTSHSQGPYWEEGRKMHTAAEWLHEEDGCVVKALAPNNHPLPRGLDYRWIWIDRDPKEQARSIRKFAKNLHERHWYREGANRKERRARSKLSRRLPNTIGMPERRRLALQEIANCGGELLVISYEKVLQDPLGQSAIIAQHINEGLCVEAMASVVHKRGAGCLPGMRENDMIRIEENAYRRKRAAE